MKLSSVLLSKLLPTLKRAINSPVWRENNISGGLLQSRLSFRAEMEQCVRWCHLSRAQKTNKSNNLLFSQSSSIDQLHLWGDVLCTLSCVVRQGPTQGLRPWQWPWGLSVIMAATCSTQSLYCKYAFTLKTHREREKTFRSPPPPSVSPSSVLQMLGSFCALCKWRVRSGTWCLNQAKIRMFPL